MNKLLLKRIFYLSIFCLIVSSGRLSAQNEILIHSHNDYHQTVPFYEAYGQMADSYEADVFYDPETKKVLVAHQLSELNAGNTLDDLYIQPIVRQFHKNKGKAWKNSEKSFYLMIDIKTNPQLLIPAILGSIEQYPDVFDRSRNPYAVTLVFTGDIPTPEHFREYPGIAFFDGNVKYNYSEDQLKRIAFFSDSFQQFSTWNGKGSIIPTEKEKLTATISKVHSLGKKIRLWGSPDNLNTWQTFRVMGIDIINTDHPEKCCEFFRNEQHNNFAFGNKTTIGSGNTVVRPDKLDKVTKSFAGFNNQKLTLPAPLSYYRPTGKNDGKNARPKNIILMIGDGMGLTQVAAADLVNNGLSFTQLKFIGLQRTQAKGNFTTDSAGAGSALATGKKTNNRYISTDENGNPNTSLTDMLLGEGKTCGVVTNGNVADATPAVFYGHSTERDNSDEITKGLFKTKLNFLAGSGESVFTKRKDSLNLETELQKSYVFLHNVDEPCKAVQKIILLDERLGEATTEDNLHLLAQTTAKAIDHLTNDKGFFLMVEGAKIDYGGHANSFPSSIIETLGFDLAVQEALKFADKNGETLVIVTADHETGGLALIDGDKEAGRITGVYSSDDHTPVFVPIFAYGPGAANFIGVYENADIFHRIIKSIH
ncbi:MAG TPA: alkaline phosphatase [Paludibacter sp.]|nr:alkaline phosphatase [Paludibacter sp.]